MISKMQKIECMKHTTIKLTKNIKIEHRISLSRIISDDTGVSAKPIQSPEITNNFGGTENGYADTVCITLTVATTVMPSFAFCN